jgi:hypothetical protein
MQPEEGGIMLLLSLIRIYEFALSSVLQSLWATDGGDGEE